MKIIQIPLLRDNYGYLIVCQKSNSPAVVDPSETETAAGQCGPAATRMMSATSLVGKDRGQIRNDRTIIRVFRERILNVAVLIGRPFCRGTSTIEFHLLGQIVAVGAVSGMAVGPESMSTEMMA